MSRKQRRGIFIGLGVVVLSLAVLLVMMALRDTVVFFLTPQEVLAKGIEPGKRFRLGGLVGAGSVKRGAGATVEFSVTDAGGTIPVRYTGVLPDLFREGQGVVTEGRLDTTGHFIADSVLAKHDETYMPPEVARKLKEQGVWQGAESAKPGAAK